MKRLTGKAEAKRYLSFDASESLLLAAHEVDMIKLSDVSSLVRVSVAAYERNFSESVCWQARA